MRAERVAVAMSGGVDSSVAAALLVEHGSEVVGLTMQVLPREPPEAALPGLRGCCGLDAVDDARGVARALGIRHYVLDLREAFQRWVIDPFCDEYVRGRTPNPCLLCNVHIKFGVLLRRATEIGAARLATGHYARVGWDEGRRRWVIWRGVDRGKDQSYTLAGLRQGQLARTLLPLGEMTKSETRAKARQLGLPVWEKPESQQICFISGRTCGDYVSELRPGSDRAGLIVDGEGRPLGRHRGIMHYTIGQRHGLRVARDAPLYVTAIDPEQNRLRVGTKQDLMARGLVMGEVNYVALADLPEEGCELGVKIRYGAPVVGCTARRRGDEVELRFARAQRAVAPGQAAVCYDGEAVALGGTIASGL